MYVAPTVQHAVPVTSRAPGRHRQMVIAPRRVRRLTGLAVRVGSVVSLAALAVIGTAVAANLSGPAAPAERPTVTVTYGIDH